VAAEGRGQHLQGAVGQGQHLQEANHRGSHRLEAGRQEIARAARLSAEVLGAAHLSAEILNLGWLLKEKVWPKKMARAGLLQVRLVTSSVSVARSLWSSPRLQGSL